MLELLAFFEQHGSGCALISDDNGHWAVSTSGMQMVPGKEPTDLETCFWVEKEKWKNSIQEALQAFKEEME